MERLDTELDDLSPEQTSARTSSPGDWNNPLLLAALGLVLMLGGYAGMNYVPLAPRQAQQERQLDEMRDFAAKRQASATANDALVERLNQVAPPWRTPPYQLPGRLAVYGGLFLFVTAGVLMYRHSPAPRKHSPEEE